MKTVKLNGGPAHRKRHNIASDGQSVIFTKIGVGQRLLYAQAIEDNGGMYGVPVARKEGRYIKSDARLKDGTEIWQWMGWKS